MRLFGIFFGATLFCLTASANIIVFGPVNLDNGGTGYTATNWTDSFTFTAFNSALGTLTEADFSLTGNMKASFTLENGDAVARDITATTTGQINLYTPNVEAIGHVNPSQADLFTNVAACEDGLDITGHCAYDYNTADADVVSVSNLLASSTTSFSITDSSILSEFLDVNAGPNYQTPVTATGSSGASGPANLGLSFSQSAGASATVTYIYTPLSNVPEPGQFAALSSALFLLGFYRLKRQRQ